MQRGDRVVLVDPTYLRRKVPAGTEGVLVKDWRHHHPDDGIGWYVDFLDGHPAQTVYEHEMKLKENAESV